MAFAYAVLDVLGAGLTLLSLVLFLLIGFLLARLILGSRASNDPLALAIATLVAGIAERTALGLALGVVGILRFEVALGVEAVLVALLVRASGGKPGLGAVANDLRQLATRCWARLVEYGVLAIVASQALFVEVTRGLLRPPLSWDSIGYHLLLAGRWLQEGRIFAPLGPTPTNFYAYNTANGSVWLWWWLAPSHSELYVNLAFLPQLLLLGLATGGVARALGARSWPVAAIVVLMTPCILRYATTQYVDIALAGAMVSGLFFATRWLANENAGNALLAGLALGVAAGSKNLGLVFVAGLVVALVPIVIARRRARHAIVAGVPLALLGGYFYLRNLLLGVGPVARVCHDFVFPEAAKPILDRTDTLVGLLPEAIRHGWLVDALLGIVQPEAMELGIGPQLVALLAGVALLPVYLFRRYPVVVWLVVSQIVVQVTAWVVFPIASAWNLFSSLRFLDTAIALSFAALVACADARGVSGRWLVGGGLLFSVQSLIQLHAEMTRGPRLVLVLLNGLLVVIAASPWLRNGLRRQAGKVTGFAIAGALLLAAPLGAFRVADRARAFATEYTAHDTAAPLFAGAWHWLDEHAADSAVAVTIAPGNWIIYPAMGLRLERSVIYVNINESNHARSIDYPSCDPRVEANEAAWLRNLSASGAAWLHVGRSLALDFPVEAAWAASRPATFRLRFEDEANRIYEILRPNRTDQSLERSGDAARGGVGAQDRK